MMKETIHAMPRRWTTRLVAVTLALAPLSGCSSGGPSDVAGVNAYSQVSSEEVEKGKSAFVDKLYAKTPPPKAPGVKLPTKTKTAKPAH